MSGAAALESEKKRRIFARVFRLEATYTPGRLGAGVRLCAAIRARAAPKGHPSPPPGPKKFCEQSPKTVWPLSCEKFSPMGNSEWAGIGGLHRGHGPSWAALDIVPDLDTGAGVSCPLSKPQRG